MVYKKLTELQPHPKNDYYFDTTEDATFRLLKDDIESSGKIRNPILITANNIIISGHQRYRAYQELGKDTIPCNVLDKKLTDDDLEYILIMENLTSRNASKGSNKIKLGRCIDKICEYCNLANGNNQYTQKRVGNNFLPIEIKSFKSKQELADAFNITPRTLNDYQNLATNGIDELETVVKSGKINDTTAIKVARLSQEEQKEVVAQITPMKKATGKDVEKVIQSVREQQNTPTTAKVENPAPEVQYDVDSVTFEELELYNKYGEGGKCEEDALKCLMEYVEDPVGTFTYLYEVDSCSNDIAKIFNNYKASFKSGHISSRELEELKDDMYSYKEWFEDLSNDMDFFMDYIDTVSQAIDTINELKDDNEISNCDDDGFLYNGAGKKIAQIENYKKKSLTYDYIEEDENDESIYYAYDENNKKIGKVTWLK